MNNQYIVTDTFPFCNCLQRAKKQNGKSEKVKIANFFVTFTIGNKLLSLQI